jgi:hypothetical protein
MRWLHDLEMDLKPHFPKREWGFHVSWKAHLKEVIDLIGDR